MNSLFAVVVGSRPVEPRSLSMIGIDTLVCARARIHTPASGGASVGVYAGRHLPPAPQTRYVGGDMPLQEKGQVLRMAITILAQRQGRNLSY